MKINQLVWSFALAFVLWLVAMPTLFAREVIAMSTLSSILSTTDATSLRFIAIGDLPYSDRETQMLRGEIAEAITKANPPFVVHYGDFKQGHWNCTDELFIASRDDIFRLRPGRVFFTPGDNDWTDCDRTSIEKPVSELERLDFLRRLFFDKPLNLPASWDYARQPNYPENARWMQNGILFATVHIVGTNNGRQEILLDDIEAALALVDARDQANRVWLDKAFTQASQVKANAVVIVTQADVTQPEGSGACTAFNRINCDAFADFRNQLIRHAANFRERGKPRKPVLLIHGDTNPYCFDKKFGGDTAPNLWRLNAWGDYQQPADANEIVVQPLNLDEPFTARTLIGQKAPSVGCD